MALAVKIFSIVTLISPDGEYGGPVRVALNQARALRAAGHDVTVVGGARGFGSVLPSELDGVPVILFPARTMLPGVGFAGLIAPSLQRWLQREGRTADVLHIHAARDLITLPVADWALRHRVPYVLQTHGMIDASDNPLARPLDALVTRRVLRGAKAVLHLTPIERADLTAVARKDVRLLELGNGVPETAIAAGSGVDTSEVLYLARLAPRKRPLAFVHAATRLGARHPQVRFTLVGPDEGEASAVRSAISEAGAVNISWEGALSPEKTVERMARADIYVLPSVDEPYPMSVLEAMSVGLPVIVTESCGLASAIREIDCGIVVDDSIDSLTVALGSLLEDPEAARELGARGRAASRERFGMEAVAQALESAYRS